MKITTIGLDLAKNVFQVHGVDGHGNAVLCKKLRRDQVASFFARLEPCLVGIEACGGAHYWAAKLAALGHRVKMMAPQYQQERRTRCRGHLRSGRPAEHALRPGQVA